MSSPPSAPPAVSPPSRRSAAANGASGENGAAGRRSTVAVAIPAYQAASTIGEVVRRTQALVDGGVVAELLVVDDGSTDATAAAAREEGARVISLRENEGKGRALATAFADLFARGHAAVVTLDADAQHLPEEVPALLAAWLEPAEDERPHLVLGSREHLFGDMSPLRRTSNRASSLLIAGAAGIDLADVQSGFRLYTRELIEAVGFPEPRFEAESAVVVRAVRAGFRVAAVPVSLGFADGRATSHYRPLADSLRIAGAVTAARLGAYRWVREPSS
jgi:glycosyltransferase involved in cell wall biosynthesis